MSFHSIWLKIRKIFSILCYIKEKQRFHIVSDYVVVPDSRTKKYNLQTVMFIAIKKYIINNY